MQDELAVSKDKDQPESDSAPVLSGKRVTTESGPAAGPGQQQGCGVPSVPVCCEGLWGLLDRLLRNREGFLDEIFQGKEIWKRLWTFLGATVLLTAVYGLSMGLMGFREGLGVGCLQMLTSAIKVPVLFLLTTAICFPVLYIVQVLMGARLDFSQALALILMALALNGILLASCAPIAFFFVVTGSSHDFVKLLHVAIFGFSGAWAMLSLWHGLRGMCERSNLYPPLAVRILQAWILVFAFVGTQMAWSLRPFVGSPGRDFTFFRQQEGNFYVGVSSSIAQVLKQAREKVD
jgi:hypothetical protein